MNAILGMSKQLQKTALDQTQQSFLDIIGCATEHLLVIINDILDLSKLEAGKTSLEEIGFHMRDLLLGASSVLGPKAEEQQLILDTYVDPAIPAILLGDPHRINQVIINLLSNAIKFTKKGKVTIDCRLLEAVGSRQSLGITVTDTGKGMDEPFLNNLFNKFSQEDDSIARSYGGTGLGLSIVKQLVELMGGSISIASKKDVGTTVSLRLSFASGQESDLPAKEDMVMDPGALRGKKILLVEDNMMNRLVAQTILKDYGLSITEATDGSIAVNAVRSQKFDLILMDMQMPIMDGIEATKRIRNDTNVPIVALTANAITGEREKCLAAGMDDYLSKPFEEEDLVRVLAKWLGVQTKAVSATHVEPETNEYGIGELKKIARGNEAIIVSLLQAFIAETRMAVTEIDQAFQAGDMKRLKAAAHRIKPSLTTLFLANEIETVKRIESGDWKAKNRPDLKSLVDGFSSGIGKVIDCIMADFPQTRPAD
jgi:CheY-like chemotaxis protein